LEKINEIDKDKINVLDIGTGSGAIAISIDTLNRKTNVIGVDISIDALEVAKINNKSLNANVKFLYSNIFSKVESKFDIIISNPPYIKNDEYECLGKNVKEFEPKLALKADEDGLFFYKKIIEESLDYLMKSGILAFEVGYNQSLEVMKMMEKKGFYDISVIQDLSGINRVVLGCRGE
ncbi:MAG: peptide chain release factor N(5)-glutamine methyltransferase, partial [Clostridiales bacterium]|nr:peptide chain release factor N(5)-glutamine methyltransferase [Clostridiales bacterium]